MNLVNRVYGAYMDGFALGFADSLYLLVNDGVPYREPMSFDRHRSNIKDRMNEMNFIERVAFRFGYRRFGPTSRSAYYISLPS